MGASGPWQTTKRMCLSSTGDPFLTGTAMTGAAAMPRAPANVAGASPEGEKRPNFLVIMVDQHNPTYFGYAGHPVVQTPNIDQLAASSVNLSRAYVTNPVCMPSRASFFTGLTTRGHRVRHERNSLEPGHPHHDRVASAIRLSDTLCR